MTQHSLLSTSSPDAPLAEVLIEDVDLASSVSLDSRSAIVQKRGDGNTILVSRMDYDGGNTRVISAQAFELSGRVQRTHLTAVSNYTGNSDLIIFSQKDGNDIVESSRRLTDNWNDLEIGTENNIVPS